MNGIVQFIGLFAGACTTFSFLPQVIKVWQSRSVKDISLYMYIVFCIGLSFWIIYGYLNHQVPIVLANGLTLVLAFSILLMKIIWK